MPLTPEEFEAIEEIYQAEVDSMIDNLGKDITMYFKQTIETPIDNEDYDFIRGESISNPVYKNGPEITYTTRDIKALIQFNPKDFKTFDDRIVHGDNILRIKTYLSEMPYLAKCDYIIPNVDAVNYIYSKYRLLREPIPIGLKANRYCISYWERIL